MISTEFDERFLRESLKQLDIKKMIDEEVGAKEIVGFKMNEAAISLETDDGREVILKPSFPTNGDGSDMETSIVLNMIYTKDGEKEELAGGLCPIPNFVGSKEEVFRAAYILVKRVLVEILAEIVRIYPESIKIS